MGGCTSYVTDLFKAEGKTIRTGIWRIRNPKVLLRHDFYEVDYLPENDRIRYTIHPDARREVLKRLLQLNHERHEEEVRNGLWDKKKSGGKKKVKEDKKAVTFADGKQEELPIYVPGEVRQGDLFESV